MQLGSRLAFYFISLLQVDVVLSATVWIRRAKAYFLPEIFDYCRNEEKFHSMSLAETSKSALTYTEMQTGGNMRSTVAFDWHFSDRWCAFLCRFHPSIRNLAGSPIDGDTHDPSRNFVPDKPLVNWSLKTKDFPRIVIASYRFSKENRWNQKKIDETMFSYIWRWGERHRSPFRLPGWLPNIGNDRHCDVRLFVKPDFD